MGGCQLDVVLLPQFLGGCLEQNEHVFGFVSPGHEGGLVGALHRGKSFDYSPILNAAKQVLGLCDWSPFQQQARLDGHICSSRGQGFGGVVGLVFHGLVCKRERKEMNFQTQKACVQMLRMFELKASA